MHTADQAAGSSPRVPGPDRRLLREPTLAGNIRTKGPRFGKRGKGQLRVVITNRKHASMGPRSNRPRKAHQIQRMLLGETSLR
jgi:hypothetical protein